MGRTKRKRRQLKLKTQCQSLKNDTKFIALLKWMNFNGWQNKTSLYPANFELTGRGLTSKKYINKGETLIEIPLKLLVSYVTIQNLEIFKNIQTKLTIHEALIVFLIHEKYINNKTSPWFEYISTLPESFNTCVECTENEINLLPDNLQSYILDIRLKHSKSFKNLQHALKNTEFNDFLTFEIFNWCFWTVNTRAVYVDPKQIQALPQDEITPFYKETNFLIDEPNMALAPFLDLFNHSVDTTTKAEISEQNLTYKLITNSKFSAYKQFFISYGAHDSIKLLCEYGFFIPNNHFDKFDLNFDEILKIHGSSLNYRQKDYLNSKLNLKKDLNVSYNGFSYNTIALFYIITNENHNNWNVKIYSNTYSNTDFGFIYTLGKKVCTHILDQYNLIEEQMTNYLNNQHTLSEFFKICLLYVKECKVLINHVITHFVNKYTT